MFIPDRTGNKKRATTMALFIVQPGPIRSIDNECMSDQAAKGSLKFFSKIRNLFCIFPSCFLLPRVPLLSHPWVKYSSSSCKASGWVGGSITAMKTSDGGEGGDSNNRWCSLPPSPVPSLGKEKKFFQWTGLPNSFRGLRSGLTYNSFYPSIILLASLWLCLIYTNANEKIIRP